MAATQQVSASKARKTITLNKSGLVPKAAGTARKRSVAKDVIPGELPLSHVEPGKMTDTIWVHALQAAGGFHRDALEMELAVNLSYFHVKGDATSVSLQVKKGLRDIYEVAGYACKTPKGEDYKTVMRRISAAADLYAHIGGRETLVDWVEDTHPRMQITKIQDQLKSYDFSGINAVLAYVGKAPVTRPRNAPAPAPAPTEAEKLAAEQVLSGIKAQEMLQASLPPGRVFTHGPMKVAIPFNATASDVMEAAKWLMDFVSNHMQIGAPATEQKETQAA